MLFKMPLLGDQLRLVADWSFPLYAEYRNGSLALALGVVSEEARAKRYFRFNEYEVVRDENGNYLSSHHKEYPITLPAGTILQLDRIYVRKGSEDYDSLTFLIVDSPTENLKPWKKIKVGAKSASNGAIRFWVKMSDINDQADVEWLVEKAPFGYHKENAALHATPERTPIPIKGSHL